MTAQQRIALRAIADGKDPLRGRHSDRRSRSGGLLRAAVAGLVKDGLAGRTGSGRYYATEAGLAMVKSWAS